MSFLKFTVQQTRWATREGNPDDQWDRGCTDGSVEIIDCTLVGDDSYDTLQTNFDVIAGDDIWLVWAQYSTGDSFGSDGGQYELCEVLKTEAEANSAVKRLEKVTDYSVPWNGYFERLDFIKAEPMVVKG